MRREVHAAIAALEYSAISVFVLEDAVRIVVVRIEDNVYGSVAQSGGMTPVALLFDAIVVATVPLAWVITRLLRSRRRRAPTASPWSGGGGRR